VLPVPTFNPEGGAPAAGGHSPPELPRLLTGDPGRGIDLLERHAKGNERFQGLTEHELLRRATRLLLIAQIVVSEELCLHAPILVPEKTAETATLLRALAKAMSAATNAFGPIGGFRTGAQ
jgi:hypothetical protein